LNNRQENDLGPIYGFQWRNSGATYKDCHTRVQGGIDQLEECRKLIGNDPTSRRIIFTAWNPIDIPKMALPPCHILGQFYVDGDNIDLQVYQRSCDVFLGLPFNIFSYSVLMYMMAHLTNKKVGRLIYILGDTHLYQNHIDVSKEQINRVIHQPPRFRIKGKIECWEDFKLDSFELIDDCVKFLNKIYINGSNRYFTF
jgi:thymidylate synthase